MCHLHNLLIVQCTKIRASAHRSAELQRKERDQVVHLRRRPLERKRLVVVVVNFVILSVRVFHDQGELGSGGRGTLGEKRLQQILLWGYLVSA